MNDCMRFEVFTVVSWVVMCLGTQCHIPGGSDIYETTDSRHQVTTVHM